MFKNAAGTVTVLAIDTATGLPKTGDAANITLYYNGDNGGVTIFSTGSGVPSEDDATNAPGCYTIANTAGEANFNKVNITGQSSTIGVRIIPILNLQTIPAAFGLTPGTAGGLLVLGANTGDMVITGSAGIALTLAGAGSAAGLLILGSGGAPGLECIGQGIGAGAYFRGGALGAAVQIVGGFTSGDGILITTTVGHGVNITANGTSKHGILSTGGTGGISDGIKAVAGTGGADIRGNITGNLVGTVSTLTTYTGNTVQTGDAYAVVNDSSFGNAKLVRSTTPANTLTVDSGHAVAFNNTSIATVTNLTNAPTSGDFTTTMKTSLNAATPAVTVSDKTGFSLANGSFVTATFGVCDFTSTQKTSIGTAVAASAVASVTGNVGGNVTGTVGSISGVTFPTNFADLAITSSTGRVTAGTVSDKTGYSLTVTPPTAAAIATAVWTDTTASDFTTALSIGKSILNGVTLGTGLTINGYTGDTPQTGDAFAYLGTNLGALGANATALASATNLAEANADLDELITSVAAIPTNPYTGTPPTAAAIATAVLTSTVGGDLGTSGSLGYVVTHQLAGAFTTASSSVFTVGALANAPTGGSAPTTAQIATAIFTDLMTGSDFNTSASFGKLVKDNLDAKVSNAVVLATSQPNYAPAKAGDAMTLTSGERDSVATALLDLASGVETGETVRKALRAIAAALAGKRSNAGTATEQYDALGNPGTTRIVGNMDSSGDGTPTLSL